MKLIFYLLTFTTIVASCDSSKKALETNKDQQMALQGDYIITQIRDNDDISPKLEISFDSISNRVTGFAGCNSFFGGYSIKGNTIKFVSIGATKKFCQAKINAIESNLLKALNTINSFSIKGNVLHLTENGKVLVEATQPISTKKNDVIKESYRTVIVYETSTRGFYEYISISGSKIRISKDRNLQTMINYRCQDKDWNTLNSLVEALDLETLHNLTAPSKERASDAAAEAVLRIQIGDVEYSTPAFDHGNPPKEIETLVNKVLSIKENTVKQ